MLAEKMGNCSGAEVRGICTEAGEYLVPVAIMHECASKPDLDVGYSYVWRCLIVLI